MLPRCTKIPKLSLTSHEKSISLLNLVNNFHHKKASICQLNISRVETLAALFHSCPPHRTLSPYIHIYRARLANFHCGALLFVTVTVHLFYLIVSSLLTIVPFAVRGWYLSYVLYPWGERIHYTTNLYLRYRYCRHSQLHKICLFLKCLWFPWGQCRSIVVHCCLCHSDSTSVLLNAPILCTSTYTCGAGSTVPRKGFDSLCLFPGVLWLWHFLYSVGPHPVSSLCIYTFIMSRALMAGAASQAGDAHSSRAPGLTSGLQGSANVHRGALLLVPQWQCISSFVFYILIFSLASISKFLRIRQKNKYVYLLSHAEKIRVGWK